MPKKICDKNEHYYDPEQDSSCPHCAEQDAHISGGRPQDNDSKTAFVDDPFGNNDSGSTEKYTGTIKIDDTVGARMPPPEPDLSKKTRILRPSGNTLTSEDVLPVAGWVVIISGLGIGRDFRLIQGENKIGRNSNMEVSLDFGDETISRDTHAIIVHDARSSTFFIERGSSRNLPLLNGQTVRKDMDLTHGDEIQIGETVLTFVPFVTDK